MCMAKEKLVTKSVSGKSESAKKNWTTMFTKPLKPKLPKKIFKSTKLNLNRYWSKIEELIGADDLSSSPLNNQLDSSYKALIEPEFIPNNQPILNVQNIKPEDLTNYIQKQFFVEKNLNRSNSGRYKSFFYDESFYHGVNLNLNQALLPAAPVIYDNQMQAYCSCCHTNTADGGVICCEPIYENVYPPVNLQNINWTFQG